MKKWSVLIAALILFAAVTDSGSGSHSGNFNDLTRGMILGTNLAGDYQFSPDGDRKVFNPGTNWSTVTNPWNPKFLTDLQTANYKIIRFMDWQSTNWSGLVQWNQRTKKHDNQFNAGEFQGDDIALEWMIDLCNRLSAHMWICMPHGASDEFILKFAQAVKYGTKSDGEPYTSAQVAPVNPPLRSDLKIFVEYSNETWNGTFADRNGKGGQYTYVNARGESQNMPGANVFYKGQAFHARRTIQVYQQWKKVFGTSPRIVRVLSSYGNEDLARHMLNSVFASSKYNPNNLYPDIFAVAPYIGSGQNGAAPGIVSKWDGWMNALFSDGGAIGKFKKVVNEWNDHHAGNRIVLCAYEGGAHFFGDSENPDAFHNRPESKICYEHMLNKYKVEFAVFLHFVHCSTVNANEAWGAKRAYGDNNDFKYVALKNYINNNQGTFQ